MDFTSGKEPIRLPVESAEGRIRFKLRPLGESLSLELDALLFF